MGKKARKGTKANRFKVGDTALMRISGGWPGKNPHDLEKCKVIEVSIIDESGHRWDRLFAPIQYKVRTDDGNEYSLRAYDIEEFIPEIPLAVQEAGAYVSTKPMTEVHSLILDESGTPVAVRGKLAEESSRCYCSMIGGQSYLCEPCARKLQEKLDVALRDISELKEQLNVDLSNR